MKDRLLRQLKKDKWWSIIVSTQLLNRNML
uniref:Uncharacterized protein n=1 Tax=Arundo donax TaxID=35708 RepID=A0A0A8Y3N1_ARUDO